jgi:zinc and cadmium transporter
MVSVLVVSAVSLVGVFTLGWRPERLRRLTLPFVAFAVGALLGDAFIHLLPTAFREARSPFLVSMGVLAGFMLFFLLERLLRGGGHVHPEGERVPLHHRVHPMVGINLAGDALHNFVDGVLIGASYLASFGLGVTTTIAVLLHELPQELGDFAILVHGGLTVRRAVTLNLLVALTAVAGTAITLLVGSEVKSVSTASVPFTAGGFLYLAAADLVPELHHQETTPRGTFEQILLIGAGIGVMAALILVG